MDLPCRKGRRVAIVGAGPGGVSAALAMLQQGYDVRVFERRPEPTPLGGAVLLTKDYLADQEKMSLQLRELAVA